MGDSPGGSVVPSGVDNVCISCVEGIDRSPMSQTQLVDGTPLPVIAHVSRVVTRVVDRLTGGRVDYPLLVAMACVEALKGFGIQSQVMYGQAAWLEVLENHSVIWAGCWGEHFSFWVATVSGEVVDLNVSVACQKRAHADPSITSIHSPPMLWSREVPAFYRYQPEGVAELDLTDAQDQKKYELVLKEVREKCVPSQLASQIDDSLEFPNEPIICPGRRILDDSRNSFRLFERTLAVRGIPSAPF